MSTNGNGNGSAKPLITYEPNPMLAWAYRRFFEHIEIDASWAEAVRAADRRGTVVYILRNLSFVDFFALDHLTKKHGLPQIRFVSDLGLSILEPMGRGWLQALKPRKQDDDAADLRRAVAGGYSAVLFLKRPPQLLEGQARGQVEGDDSLRTLFDLQRTVDRPILLVPQVFVWSRQADEQKRGAVDLLFGPREWPGKVRSTMQFAMNFRHVTLRAGDPLDLKQFLANETKHVAEERREPATEQRLVRRATYTLLRRLERERHAVLGPTKKPADRLRDEVVRSPKLQKIIHDMAGEGEAERRVLTWRANAMLREMEASLDMNAVAAMDVAVQAMVDRIYTDEEVDEEGIARIRQAAKDGTLVFLPSHKSHFDYILLARIFFRRKVPMPVIAAGDNLNFFPLGPILRRAGAFYIRRTFHGDRLYAAVVDAYVRRLLRDGYPLEFFLEGGRSRGGKLLAPKLGLLSLVVDAAVAVQGRPVYFCPISVGYERVVEEKAFLRELSGGEKSKEDVKGLMKSAELFVGKYGRLNVQFGELFTLEQIAREMQQARQPQQTRASIAPTDGPESARDREPEMDLAKLTPAKRRTLVQRLAFRVMNEINRVTAVTSGALVATALLSHGRRGMSQPELLTTCKALAATLRHFGARFTPSLMDKTDPADPTRMREEALFESLDLFVRAGHVEVRRIGDPESALANAGRAMTKNAREAARHPDAVYVVPETGRRSMNYSKNIVVHFFIDRGLVATGLLAQASRNDDQGMGRDVLDDRVRTLSRLFKHEFLFRGDAPFEQIIDETLADMVKDGELTIEGNRVRVSEAGRQHVNLYAQIVKPFVEGYLVAARGLSTLLRGPATSKEITKRTLATGDKMYMEGEIERREAVSRELFENAFASFVDQGYCAREEGKLALTETYAAPDTLRTIERKIAAFVVRELS